MNSRKPGCFANRLHLRLCQTLYTGTATPWRSPDPILGAWSTLPEPLRSLCLQSRLAAMTSKNRSVPVDTALPHVNSQRGERRERESEPLRQAVSLLDFGLRRHSLPPGALDNGDIAVDGKIGEGFHTFARRRPANLQAIYFLRRTDAQHLAGVMRRKIAPAANLQSVAFQIARLPCHFRADSIMIGFLPVQSHSEPVVFRGCDVFQKKWRTVVDVNQLVDGAVIIEVADGHSARRKALRKGRAGSITDILQSAPRIAKQEQWLLVADTARVQFDFVVGVAIGYKQIHVAVVIVIEEFHSPAAHEPRQAAEPHLSSHVFECQVMVVAVNRIHLLIDVCDEEVLPSVLVEIRRIHTHPRALPPRLVISYACFEGFFFKLSMVRVDKKKVGNRIVGHKQIHPTAVVDVRGDDTPSFTQCLGDP